MGDFDPATEGFEAITNRHGLQVFVKVVSPPGATRNAYLAHGFSDVHDTAHMRALTSAFVRAGYNVIIWDATHSWGRSEGSAEQASFYYHHEDLEDVLDWSRGQAWYREQYALAGHSLGGMVAGTYAAAHSAQVERLVLVAPVVSGPALRRRLLLPLQLWRPLERQMREFLRSSWSYDLVAAAHRITMPVLIVAAGRDILIPPRLMRRLLRALKGAGSALEIVSRARHGFDSPSEAAQLEQIVRDWLTNEG